MRLIVKILIFMMTILLTSPSIAAGKSYVPIIKRGGQSSSTGRPGIPSKQIVICYYEDGTLFIEFRLSEGITSLSIDNQTYISIETVEFDSSLPYSYYIGEIENGISIRMETEKGNIYEGEIGI